MVVVGILLLYVLRDLLIKLILFLLGFLGIVIALVLIVAGFAMLVWKPKTWYRVVRIWNWCVNPLYFEHDFA